MKTAWHEKAWKEYLEWAEQDKKTWKKINSIVKDIERNGESEGIGKPERLTGNLRGLWSRRIDEKNRLIYYVENDYLEIILCKGHYFDK